MPSPPMEEEEEEEEEEETEDEEEDEEEEEDSQVQGEQPKVCVWGRRGVTGWRPGHSLTLPLPQEAPPPLVPPQPAASPPEEDKMPPYDEQTQAFIDGEGWAGEGGDRVQTCAPTTCTRRGP